ncbi:MAG TPA: porin [Steroidobacteraceae bacterium]|nr:porin [Steroidobacteraceae bacterium]
MTPIRACLLTASLAAAGVAQAQTASPPSNTSDDSLTWKGITLYGTVDVGLQYQTHGAPASDYSPYGTEPIIQKNSNGSVTALTPNNEGQSRIGLAGNEPLLGDWAAVFRLESAFNPQSGVLVDGPRSLTANNGVALTAQKAALDSSLAGQTFNSAAYVGVASPTVGSFTFGRQLTTLADGIAAYDPQGTSPAFSLFGGSGTFQGGGDTEDKRLNNAFKYAARYDWLNIGGLYQFSGSSGSFNTAVQAQLGVVFAGFSIDGFYAKKYDAVSSASLSLDQVQGLAALCNPPVTPVPAPTTATCYSASNSLSGTISDNTVYAVMAKYAFETVKLYAGYENIKFANPTTPIEAGFVIPGGYTLAYTNNTEYNNNKTFNVYWGGVRWTVVPQLDLTVAYYGYKQNAFGTGADAGCSTAAHSSCSGQVNLASLQADYRLSKRFDVYIGTMWSQAQDGLANEFLNTSTLTSTLGARFKF